MFLFVDNLHLVYKTAVNWIMLTQKCTREHNHKRETYLECAVSNRRFMHYRRRNHNLDNGFNAIMSKYSVKLPIDVLSLSVQLYDVHSTYILLQSMETQNISR